MIQIPFLLLEILSQKTLIFYRNFEEYYQELAVNFSGSKGE